MESKWKSSTSETCERRNSTVIRDVTANLTSPGILCSFCSLEVIQDKNVMNIRYALTMLITKPESKLQELLKIVKERNN